MTNYIDLTRVVDVHTPVYPGDKPLEILKTGDLDADGFLMHEIKMGMHVGTHMDAPAHFLENGMNISEVNLEIFFGKGKVVEIGKEITANTLDNAAIVLIKTGMAEKWGSEEYFKAYPEISESLVPELIAAKVRMICVDMPSVDYPPHNVHKRLLAEDILIVENVCNLDKVPEGIELRVTALPIKLTTEAAPCRVIAELNC